MPSAACPRCTAQTKGGERCKRTTCRYAPFCAAHKAFRVDESTIPDAGRGIFATKQLRRGDTIGDYTIATVDQSEDEFLASYPNARATHTAKIKDRYFTALGEGTRTQNGIGMANRAPRGRKNNAKIIASGRVVASQGIPPESEIFLAYGPGFKI